MTVGITAKQARVLAFVAAYMDARDRSPTLEEIRDGLGYKSKNTVRWLSLGLRERGKISWIDRRPRSLVLLAERGAGHALPADLQARLEKYCAARNERPADVLADAATLHLDDCEDAAAREAAMGAEA